MKTQYRHRLLARIVIQASTALAVGKGEKSILTDAVVATDVNGLPYIPGTALAGVIRHELEHNNNLGNFFGYQDGDEGKGSEIIFTDAKILDRNSRVVDGLKKVAEIESDDFLLHYKNLPIRQHVKINSCGVTAGTGKFDEEVVYAGTRFCFEIEIVAKNNDSSQLDGVIGSLFHQSFRLGSGTRCGYGEIEVVDIQTRKIDLDNDADLELYLSKSSSLDAEWNGWNDYSIKNDVSASLWSTYTLKLSPKDVFSFGSGLGDADADSTPVRETKINWKNSKGSFSKQLVLIPATSVKGAIAHRVAYHYNRLIGNFLDKPIVTPLKETAVEALFGTERDKGIRGNVLLSDVYQDLNDHTFTHVGIDRFTGGQRSGALYNEKVALKGETFNFTISVLTDVFTKNINYKKAFENTLKDICEGRLPLGGMVNRGHGIFTGTCSPKIV